MARKTKNLTQPDVHSYRAHKSGKETRIILFGKKPGEVVAAYWLIGNKSWMYPDTKEAVDLLEGFHGKAETEPASTFDPMWAVQIASHAMEQGIEIHHARKLLDAQEKNLNWAFKKLQPLLNLHVGKTKKKARARKAGSRK